MEMFYWDETAQDYLPVTGPDGTIKVTIDGMQPVDVQGHSIKTVPCHNAVLVPLSGASTSASWIDTQGPDGGYITVDVTQKSNNSLNGRIQILWSHDGVTVDIWELVTGTTGAMQYRFGQVPIRARWMKLHYENLDSATPSTISSWAYLKA